MCCHRLYVFGSCGHTLFAPNPIVRCSQASITPDGPYSATCEIVAHPFQSWKLESLCPECNQERSKRISDIEETQKIRFDDWKWKVRYGMPAYGKDYWSRKAEERERLEKEAGKKKRRSARFSWMKLKKDKRVLDMEMAKATTTRSEATMDRRTATL